MMSLCIAKIVAKATRCFSPPDSVSSSWSANASKFNRAIASVTRRSMSATGNCKFSNANVICSRAVRIANWRSGFWNSIATRLAFSNGAIGPIDWPSKRTSPFVTTPPNFGSKPAIALSNVDLPEPEGPTIKLKLPGVKSKCILFKMFGWSAS